MGTPAAVMGDKITGICASHQIPGPTGPTPAGPQPFEAMLVQQLATTVKICGKAAAVQGSAGLNTQHPQVVDTPGPTQRGTVMMGSATVLIEGKGAAKTGSTVSICLSMAGQLVGTASTVLIGG